MDYVVGLACNQRLEGLIEGPLAEAKQQFEATAQPARIFVEFAHKTLKAAWNKDRLVVAKAEHMASSYPCQELFSQILHQLRA